MSAPPVTAGGRYTEQGTGFDPAGLKFDWYQATIRQDSFANDPDSLIGLLHDGLGGVQVEGDRGLHGYSDQAVIRRHDGDVIARVLYGGSNRWPNCWSSGDRAPAMARLLRSEIPGHHVTRADVAYDVIVPGGFELLQGECLAVADARGLSVSQAGDWHRLEAGRTLYCGSRQSEVFTRLYEKGLEQIGKAPSPEHAAAVPRDWQRLELVIKPRKAPRRAAAAVLEPVDMFGYAIWSRELAARLWALDIPAVDASSWSASDEDRALAWLVRQYGSTLAARADRLGGWELLGLQLGRMVEQRLDRVE